jgi:AraC-like DNA-binding protein
MTKLVFAALEDMGASFEVLELVPDTHAWAKDLQGHFVLGNRLFYERFGISSAQGLAGKTDFDIAPADMAQKYVDDDEQVLQGRVITDRLELIGGPTDHVEWFLTSKWPVYSPVGDIIGSLGMSRHLNRSERKSVPFHDLNAPISYIGEHFASKLSVDAIAKACNISISALERRFRKHLGKTPRRYINEVRLDHARRLLVETDKSIGTIALETGFADHSHFTRAYASAFGKTPSNERDRTTP